MIVYQWLFIVVLVVSMFSIGHAIFKKITSVQFHPVVVLAISWVISFFTICLLLGPLLFLSLFQYAPIVFYVWIFTSLIFIKPLFAFILANKNLLFGVVPLFIFVLVFTQAKDFNLLWDARSSWFLKSQSFFYESVFPNKLFSSSETWNIVKDYPVWHSVYFGGLGRAVGEYSDLFNKFLQAITTTLWISSVYILLSQQLKYYIVKIPVWIKSLILTLLLLGNYKFLEWTRSGYVDIFMSLIFLLVGHCIVMALEQKNKSSSANSVLSLGLILACFSLLLKNEGISLVIAFAAATIYFLTTQGKIKISTLTSLINKHSTSIVILIAINYIWWNAIKRTHGYTSDLLGGVSLTWERLQIYVYHSIRLPTLIFNDLFAPLWNYTMLVFVITFFVFILLIILKIIKNESAKPFHTMSFYIGILSFFFILAYIITPELRFDFFYLVTFDRVVLQFLPVLLVSFLFVFRMFESNTLINNKRNG